MFGSKKAEDVTECLKEGRTWVNKLDTAVKATKVKANEKDKEITKLTQERTDLDALVEEGTTVANNFKEMLAMNKE